ncbi:MAG: hypothetical protein AB7V52_10205, partial [Methanothrix sp.]
MYGGRENKSTFAVTIYGNCLYLRLSLPERSKLHLGSLAFGRVREDRFRRPILGSRRLSPLEHLELDRNIELHPHSS